MELEVPLWYEEILSSPERTCTANVMFIQIFLLLRKKDLDKQ
jgi:hypothetical protein